MARSGCAWLLHRFSPFPARHPVCKPSKLSYRLRGPPISTTLWVTKDVRPAEYDHFASHKKIQGHTVIVIPFLSSAIFILCSFYEPAAAGTNSESVAWIYTGGGEGRKEGALFGGKFKLAHSFRENCIRSAPRHASKRVSPSSGNSTYDS